MVRVLGDGIAALATQSVGRLLDTTDVVDRSVARSTTASWLDLNDPAHPDEGSNHRALVATNAEAPDLVLLSLGADLVPPTTNDAMGGCQPVSTQSPGGSAASTVVADCARAVLATEHYRQRVMAIAFDVLAHTRVTRLVIVGTGGASGTIEGTIDEEAAAAVAAIADAGATWADRVAWSPSPVAVTDVLRQRDWN